MRSAIRKRWRWAGSPKSQTSPAPLCRWGSPRLTTAPDLRPLQEHCPAAGRRRQRQRPADPSAGGEAAEDGEHIMQKIDQEGETVAMMSLTVMPGAGRGGLLQNLPPCGERVQRPGKVRTPPICKRRVSEHFAHLTPPMDGGQHCFPASFP